MRYIFFLATWIILSPALSQAIDQLYPVSWTHYGILEGLPDPCVENAYVTPEGRLVLIGCNYVRFAHGLDVYLFDGNQAFPTKFSQRPEIQGLTINFEGVDRSERLYGYAYPEDGKKWDSLSYFFLYHPVTEEGTFIPFGLEHEHKGLLLAATSSDGELFLLTCPMYSNRYEILSWKDGVMHSLHWFDNDKKLARRHSNVQFEVTASHFWIADSTDVLVRLSRRDGNVQTYAMPQSTSQYDVDFVADMSVTPSGNVIICSRVQNKILEWNAATETFVSDAYLPKGLSPGDVIDLMLTKDLAGNTLFVHQDLDGKLHGLLLDSENRQYDYTKVLAILPPLRNLYMGSGRWSSPDFKKGIFGLGTYFMSMEVASQSKVHAIGTSKGTRALAEISDSTMIIFPFGMYHLTAGGWSLDENDEINLSEVTDGDIARDMAGNVWASNTGGVLFKYDVKSKKRTSYSAAKPIRRFVFLDANTMLVGFEDNTLCEFYPGRGSFAEKAYAYQLPGFINQLFVGNDKKIWAATSHGLIHLEDQFKYELINEKHGLSESRIIRIHQDSLGRLWLGTFMGGLHLYDPRTHEVKVINERNGLSNNTVVSILEDHDHFIWVGTFNGVNVLWPDGKILGQLYAQDGLASNECNRWSSLRLQDGRLCFGSIAGVSILDPPAIRAQMQSRDAPKIYLTRLVHAGQSDDLAVFTTDSTNTVSTAIILPASNRSLQLGFALSEYSSPDKNTFAYQIEGHDKDWQYLGSQKELVLSRLPAGKYRIHIIGADHRGQWTPKPVILTIEAKEFFYKEGWFYILGTFLLVTITVIWHHRQQIENKRLELEVQKRTETIRHQTDELREMDRIKTQLYTNITHEFRTPLTVIDGMADHLTSDANAPLLIKRNARNLLNLVNQMLDLRKLESGSLPLHMVQTDVVRFIRYLAESFKALATTKNVGFHFLADVPALMMDIDPEKLQQILANLLSNAIKFTPAGGNVYLQISQEGTMLCIKVSDSGIGIPENNLPHIFKRFYQVDHPDARASQGTGIGLSLTTELVQLLHGDLSVVSQEGKGSVFMLKLPIHRQAEVKESLDVDTQRLNQMLPGLQSIQLAVLSDAIDSDQLPLVLIVEDNEDVVHYLTTCLKGHYRVEIERNGHDGIAKAMELVPDAIVSDVMMPVKDGFALCETLKNEVSTSHVPIILLTARADVESRIAGLKRGADAYLAKPFHAEELLVQIESLIGSRKKLHLRYQSLQSPLPTTDEAMFIEDAFVKRFRMVIEKEMDNENLDIPQIALALNLSRAQLHRKITALTGKSASALLRSIRLEAAKKHLHDPNLNIAQVAYTVGFKYPENFSRAFSEEFGVTPSQWRETQN